jgi:hypothetical protein
MEIVMPTNILSFGCSHSLGYYNMDNSPSNEKTWPELLFNNSTDVNFHVHFALPGHGVVDYCFLLMKLEENGVLNNVHKIVIQHTSEPRCVFYTQSKIMEKFFHYRVMPYFDTTMVRGTLKVLNVKDFNLESFIVRPINLTSRSSFAASVGEGAFDGDNAVDTQTRLELVDQFDRMSGHFMNSTTVLNIIQLSYEKIQQIVAKHNIELYEFRWPGMLSPFNNVPIIGSDVEDYDNITNGNGHVIEEHIDKLNSEILELVSKNGFFK